VLGCLMLSGDNGLGGRLRRQAGPAGLNFGGMSGDQATKARAAGALLTAVLCLCVLALGGCSTPVADLPLGGASAEAPPGSKESGAYLPVNELPPEREEAAMTATERTRVQSELLAARERQAAAAAAKDAAAK